MDSLHLLNGLDGRIRAHALVDCEYCEEPVEFVCASCQATNFEFGEREIRCAACATTVDERRVVCAEGHTTSAPELSNLITLTPLSNLLEPVSQLVAACSEYSFDPAREFFRVKGTTLYFSTPERSSLYTLSDLEDVSALLVGAPNMSRPDIGQALGDFKEKWDCMSTENCGTCVDDAHHTRCYLRLFGLFDPEYTPRPHQGHEYGDYSRTVSIRGRSKQLVVAMKSSTVSNRRITRNSALGREIHSQVAGYFNDPTVDIVAISVPRKLEEGFAAEVRLMATRVAKAILFIHADELERIVASVMARRGLRLEDV